MTQLELSLHNLSDSSKGALYASEMLMRTVYILFSFLIFSNVVLIEAKTPSSTKFMELIKRDNIEGVQQFFSAMERNPPTLFESRKFIKRVSKKLSVYYKTPQDHFSLENLKKELEKRLKNLDSSHILCQ